MRIFGPLVWDTTSALTRTPARAAASLVTSVPSTTRRAGSVTAAPAATSSFSTVTTSPTATLYCLPPVLTMAYIVNPLLSNNYRDLGARGRRLTVTPPRYAGTAHSRRAVVQITAQRPRQAKRAPAAVSAGLGRRR